MQLRDYQVDSCNATWGHLFRGPEAGNPVICLPTGSGKSLVIAELVRAAIETHQGRVMVLAHRKELLSQNAEKIRALLPHIPIGVYSAGLRRFGMDEDVIVAGIQSVHKRASVFGRRHLCLIDEVHLVPRDGEGMYRNFLEDLKEYNPRLRLVGLTATPYRTGEGSICSPEGMFQSICYDAKIQPLIGQGYLCPITSTVAEASVDTSGLHIRGGEFIQGEAERLFDLGDNVARACLEIVGKCKARKSIMLFCAGVLHANDVANKIEALTGERVGLVTGESSALERSGALADFKSQRLRWLVNVDVLTTGFDAPCVDAIAVLRATASPGLFAQICGRGLRTHVTKENCLLLDFGENIKRHGPIDADDYGTRSRKREQPASEPIDGAPTKECPGCRKQVATNTRQCECGFIFPVNHEATSASQEVLAVPQKFAVVAVDMARHRKRQAAEGTPDTLRIDYTCEPLGENGNLTEERISEWVCLEHPPGFARTKAVVWWQAHTKAGMEESNEESPIEAAIDLWKRGAIAMPHTITARREGHFWRIIQAELDELPETWSEPGEVAETWEDVEAPF